jgi:hypothetical protein
MGKGLALMVTTNYGEALKYIDKVLSIDPTNLSALDIRDLAVSA